MAWENDPAFWEMWRQAARLDADGDTTGACDLIRAYHRDRKARLATARAAACRAAAAPEPDARECEDDDDLLQGAPEFPWTVEDDAILGEIGAERVAGEGAPDTLSGSPDGDAGQDGLLGGSERELGMSPGTRRPNRYPSRHRSSFRGPTLSSRRRHGAPNSSRTCAGDPSLTVRPIGGCASGKPLFRLLVPFLPGGQDGQEGC
jgi:hypothetical protein